ncbi:MAG: tetratricopeptide repeat protein [Thermoanaerobaculia bacterium]
MSIPNGLLEISLLLRRVKIHDPDMQWLRNLIYREKIPSLEAVRYQFEQTPSLTNRLRLGQALHDAEKYQEGADLFSKVLETQPRERDALFGLGLCKIGLNELADAVPIFEQLIESDRTFNDFEPWILLSRSLWGLERRPEVLELLHQLVKTSPRTRHAVTLAHFQLEAGNSREAFATLRQALEHYEHAPKFVKRNDRPWARQAKKMIKAVGPGQAASA